MKKATEVSCPICTGPSPYRGEQNGYSLYRCAKCGHFFVWPVPTHHLDIYSEAYFAGADQGFGYVEYDRDKAPMVPTFQLYLDRIVQARGATGKLLDVGAATGFFLSIAQQRGFQVTGVEPSAFAAELARKKGLAVSTGTLDAVQFDDERFDVITLWDVLEHLPDPIQTLNRVNHLLNEQGVIAINTPDASSLLARALGRKWHLVVPPEHLNLFHVESLRIALEKSGFSIVAKERIGKCFTLEYVAGILGHWTNLALWEKMTKFLHGRKLGSLGLSINLRDNIFVLAKKRMA